MMAWAFDINEDSGNIKIDNGSLDHQRKYLTRDFSYIGQCQWALRWEPIIFA